MVTDNLNKEKIIKLKSELFDLLVELNRVKILQNEKIKELNELQKSLSCEKHKN